MNKLNFQMRWLMLFITMLPTMLATAQGWSFCVDGIYYSITSPTTVSVTYRIVNSADYSGEVHIPESVECNGIEYSVTSIGGSAFRECTGLTSVTIPHSVTTIGDYAFCKCSSLTSFVIPNSVTSIGNYAFNVCSSIRTLIIEDGDSVLKLGYSYIGRVSTNGQFDHCSSLETLHLGRKTNSLDNGFSNKKFLKTVTIGSSVTQVVDFSGCSNLTTVSIPNSVTYIYRNTFSGCSNLTSITIPNSVIEIRDYAFYGCSELKFISIGTGVKSIGIDAFKGISNKCVTEINSPTLWSQIQFDNYLANPIFTSEKFTVNGVAPKHLVLNLGNKKVSDFAFIGSKQLETVKVVASEIGKSCFSGCIALKKLDLDVNKIGDNAFGTSTFGSNLSSYPCWSLDTIYVERFSPPIASGNTFDRYGVTLYVPNNAVSLYKKDRKCWSNFTNIFTTDFSDIDNIFKADYVDNVEGAIPTSVTLDKTMATINVSESLQLTATVIPKTAINRSVTWSTSDASIAMVSNTGLVSAVAVGKATITATTANGKTATCVVTVEPNQVATVDLNYTEQELRLGDSFFLIATVSPETTNKSIVWKSSDENVVTVDDNGKVLAVGIGTATIMATASSQASASCKVTVLAPLATSIKLVMKSISATPMSSVQLTATVLPKEASNQQLEWISSNESIATVSATGLVYVKAEGEVEITVTTTDGSNLSATCRINPQSGIDDIYVDENETHDIYSISGIIVRRNAGIEEFKSLSSGIYIIDGRNIIKR